MIYSRVSKPPTRDNPEVGRRAGFTLLEVLVSLTIMAIITSVAFAGLSIGIDSWHRGTRKIDELDRRFLLERIIQRQIAFADQIFTGDGFHLEFATTYSLANGSGDAVYVKYGIGPEGWTYSEAPLIEYLSNPSAVSVTQTFSAASITGFKYLYETPGNQNDWFNEPMMQQNPLAIRVDVSGEVLTIPLLNKQPPDKTAKPNNQ